MQARRYFCILSRRATCPAIRSYSVYETIIHFERNTSLKKKAKLLQRIEQNRFCGNYVFFF